MTDLPPPIENRLALFIEPLPAMGEKEAARDLMADISERFTVFANDFSQRMNQNSGIPKDMGQWIASVDSIHDAMHKALKSVRLANPTPK